LKEKSKNLAPLTDVKNVTMVPRYRETEIREAAKEKEGGRQNSGQKGRQKVFWKRPAWDGNGK